MNVKIHSLYGSPEERGFVKADVGKALQLRECPLGELALSVNHLAVNERNTVKR